MIRTSSISGMALALVVATGVAAFAQTATDAQKAAIRSDCTSDFLKYCKGVEPGGAPAVECLNKNMESLAPACQAAVEAVLPKSQ